LPQFLELYIAPAQTTSVIPRHGCELRHLKRAATLTSQDQPTAPAYVYDVKMTCGGCSGAIERVLKKNIEARESQFPPRAAEAYLVLPPFNAFHLHIPIPHAANAFSVSLGTQKVIIWGPKLPEFEDITAKIAKTGKEIRSKEVAPDTAKLGQLTAST
jgi:copper chaperone